MRQLGLHIEFQACLIPLPKSNLTSTFGQALTGHDVSPTLPPQQAIGVAGSLGQWGCSQMPSDLNAHTRQFLNPCEDVSKTPGPSIHTNTLSQPSTCTLWSEEHSRQPGSGKSVLPRTSPVTSDEFMVPSVHTQTHSLLSISVSLFIGKVWGLRFPGVPSKLFSRQSRGRGCLEGSNNLQLY